MDLPPQGAAPLLALTLLVALPLTLGCWLIPPRGDVLPTPGQGRLSRLVPGLSDLAGGAPGRGLAALAGAFLVLTAIGVHATVNWGKDVPVAGPLTALTVPSVLRAFPLPPHPSRWALYSAYADAPYFWGLVVAAGLLSVGLHMRRRRSDPPAKPPLSATQAEDEPTRSDGGSAPADDRTRSRPS
jgi:hypothetical protein